MSNKKIKSNVDVTFSDPASPKYSENIKNKAHEKSPYGEAEPSTGATYK